MTEYICHAYFSALCVSNDKNILAICSMQNCGFTVRNRKFIHEEKDLIGKSSKFWQNSGPEPDFLVFNNQN